MSEVLCFSLQKGNFDSQSLYLTVLSSQNNFNSSVFIDFSSTFIHRKKTKSKMKLKTETKRLPRSAQLERLTSFVSFEKRKNS